MSEHDPGADLKREAEQLVDAARRWLGAIPQASSPPDPAAATGNQPDDDQSTAAPQQPDHAEQRHTCQGCPWCRARSAAGPLGAETLDSLADLLGSAAESLRAFAHSRREAGEGTHEGEDPSTGP